jgi:hypothetical protein
MARVQVQRHPQFLQPGPERVEPRLVQVSHRATDLRGLLRPAVHQHAVEAELGHRAGDLRDGGVDVLRRDGGEPAEPVQMCSDRLSEDVVGAAGPLHGDGRVGLALHTGAGQGDHRVVDAVAVHLRQPDLGSPRSAAAPAPRAPWRTGPASTGPRWPGEPVTRG